MPAILTIISCNSIHDNQAKIAVTWNLYNKIDEVRPLDTTAHKPALRFTYDASGNRVSKEVNTKPFPYTGTTPTRLPEYITTTYYIRDASGNIMSVYQRTNDSITGKHGYYTATYKLEEQPMYGSSRVGEYLPDTLIAQKVFAQADMDKIKIDTTLFVKETENINLAATSQSVSHLHNDASVAVFIDSITINNYAYSSGNYTPSKKVSFVGSMCSNIAQAENSNGRPVIFSATPTTYWGDSSVCLVYDSTGYLMANSDSIQSSYKGKSVIMQKPGSSTQYYLFTVSAGKLYYHTIDISTKQVISKNTLLDNTSSPGYTYGDHLTLLEDTYTNTGMLYATQYTPGTGSPIGTLNIVAFTITTKSPAQVPTVMTSFPAVSNGYSELQISPDGKKLVVYNHLLKTGWFDHQESEIRTFNLGTDFKIVNNPVVSIYPVVSLPNGTKSGMSVDFTSDNRYLYFGRSLLIEINGSTGGENTTWRYDYRDNDTNLVKAGLMGDVRRGDNGDINIAGTNLQKLDNWSQDPEGVATLNVPSATIGDSLTGALPIQSHKIYQDAPTVPNTFTRTLALKQYDITDHLDNIVLVVSDRKNVSIIGSALYDTADVVSYSSYYPFGMRQVGRYKNGNLVAYGYNGKRYDNEVDGTDDFYDYGARIYDGRIAKFLSIDPIAGEYSELTPYQFASLSPIAFVDLDGLERLYYEIKKSNGTLGIPVLVKKEEEEIIFDIGFIKLSEVLKLEYRVNFDGQTYLFHTEEEFNKFAQSDDDTKEAYESEEEKQATIDKAKVVYKLVRIIDYIAGGQEYPSQPSVHTRIKNINHAVESSKSSSPITGYTKHGINQAVGRNGGKGVNIKEMNNAVRNPKSTVQQANGTTKYVGNKATVITNKDGKVVTTYGKSRGQQIYQQGRATGGGKAQRKANQQTGASYNPNMIR